MSVKLRLRRLGRKKRPLYGLVATDSRSPRDGRFIEDLGRYNPLQEPAEVLLERERILYWLGEGAQPSDTVRSLLSSEGILLAYSLQKKGLSSEEIQEQVEAHRARRAEKAASKTKTTREDRIAEALKAETALAAEKEVELAKARAEAEAKAKAEADAAKKKAAEEVEAQREAAARAAKEEQAEKNEAQAAEDSKPSEATADAPATEVLEQVQDTGDVQAAEESPVAEAMPEAEKVEAPAEAEASSDEKKD